jgi:hypothetical protein
MTTLSETLTLGLVLVLLFGSICLYLYTRVQQTEQKLNLIESILLDLKMTSEIKNYPELAAPGGGGPAIVEASGGSGSGSPAAVIAESKELAPMPEETVIEMTASEESLETIPASSAAVEVVADGSKAPAGPMNYSEMTLSELKALAKQRGIVGGGGMRRAQLIEALQTSDRATGSMEDRQPFLESISA